MQHLNSVTTLSIAIMGEGGRGIEDGFSGGVWECQFESEQDDSVHFVVGIQVLAEIQKNRYLKRVDRLMYTGYLPNKTSELLSV